MRHWHESIQPLYSNLGWEVLDNVLPWFLVGGILFVSFIFLVLIISIIRSEFF